jgi:DNA-directed RNA polymerase subunit M/transcription elongation factor TFIIS
MRCCNCNAILGDKTSTDTVVLCDSCGSNFKLTTENSNINVIGTSGSKLKEEILNIKIGSVVILRNEDHIFHGQKVKIIDKKHKFVKIDLVGRRFRDKLWIPNEWVECYETN